LWQEHLTATGLGPNVCCAAFDAREMPIRSGSIAAVSGVIAFNIRQGREALREVLRVLRPGGVLVTHEVFLAAEDLELMPSDLRLEFEHEAPIFVGGLGGVLRAEGMALDYYRTTPGHDAQPHEHPLFRRATDLGISLHVMNEFIRPQTRVTARVHHNIFTTKAQRHKEYEEIMEQNGRIRLLFSSLRVFVPLW